jgi:hypothetical protein
MKTLIQFWEVNMGLYIDTLGENMKTSRCIHCLNRAKLYTGHVKLGSEFIYAGFCSDDCLGAMVFDSHGCAGEWKLEYGIEKWQYDLNYEQDYKKLPWWKRLLICLKY